MDQNTALLSTGTGGTILGVLLYIYTHFNHKRIRSKCCGQDLDMSLDIENTTPPAEKVQQSVAQVPQQGQPKVPKLQLPGPTAESFHVQNPMQSNA